MFKIHEQNSSGKPHYKEYISSYLKIIINIRKLVMHLEPNAAEMSLCQLCPCFFMHI